MFKYIHHVFSLIAFSAVFNLLISSPCANNLLEILRHIWHSSSTGGWDTFLRVHSTWGQRSMVGSTGMGRGNTTEGAIWNWGPTATLHQLYGKRRWEKVFPARTSTQQVGKQKDKRNQRQLSENILFIRALAP